MGGKNPKIVVFIPAYNAEKTLQNVLDRIPASIKKQAIEILVADDASKDQTFKSGLEYKAKTKERNLRIVRHKKNKGYGGNQKWAYNYCIKKRYDMVVMLHGDAQYAPEIIPELLKPLQSHTADMVFGSRMTGNPLKGGMPIHKFIGNKILTWMENRVLKLNLSEYHSGYRLYSCEALKKIPFNECSDGFHFDTEIMIQFKIANLVIKEIPIPTHYGSEKCHVNIMRYGWNIIKTLRQYRQHKKGTRFYKKFDIQEVKQNG